MILRVLIIIVVLLLAGAASAQDAKATRVFTIGGAQITGVIAGQIALDDAVSSVVLIQGKDIERIDDAGIHLKRGAEMLGCQITLISNTEVFSSSPRVQLFETMVANKPKPGEKRRIELPRNSGMDIILLVAEAARTIKPARGILGEFQMKDGKGSIVPSLNLSTASGARKIAVDQIVEFKK